MMQSNAMMMIKTWCLVPDENLKLGNLSPTIYFGLETTQSGCMFCWLQTLLPVDKASKHLGECSAGSSIAFGSQSI
jgi:hypothetical protein